MRAIAACLIAIACSGCATIQSMFRERVVYTSNGCRIFDPIYPSRRDRVKTHKDLLRYLNQRKVAGCKD